MDRGAWQATVHIVAKSPTQLRDGAHTHIHTHTHARDIPMTGIFRHSSPLAFSRQCQLITSQYK